MCVMQNVEHLQCRREVHDERSYHLMQKASTMIKVNTHAQVPFELLPYCAQQ